jgi:hypothetical protein
MPSQAMNLGYNLAPMEGTASTANRSAKGPDLRSAILKERHALLQRVLWSHQIKNSGRIRDFLVYVFERALEEPGAEIHEQEIGCRVFGRAEDYDTSIDNVVRVTASQVRKKLEIYFAGDGASEPVILEIPKGRYTPLFRERSLVAEPTPAPTVEIAAPTVPRYKLAILVLSISTVLLGIFAGILIVRLRSTKVSVQNELEKSPGLNALWSQLVTPTGRTEIVLPDSSLSLLHELLSRQLTLAEYLQTGQWVRPEELSSNPELKSFAELVARRGFTSMASVTAVYRIAQLVGSEQSRLSVLRARDFTIQQMKYDNVVLLGSNRANPWQELIQDRLNFRFGYNQKSRYAYFENARPQAGEKSVYSTDSGVSYCRVAFLPNLTGNGNILSISGTEIEGTEGGGEFVTNELSMKQLRELIGASRSNRLPYFEALLTSSRVGGQTPRLSVIAFRLLHP